MHALRIYNLDNGGFQRPRLAVSFPRTVRFCLYSRIHRDRIGMLVACMASSEAVGYVPYNIRGAEIPDSLQTCHGICSCQAQAKAFCGLGTKTFARHRFVRPVC